MLSMLQGKRQNNNLFEVRGIHVFEGLGGDTVVGQDGQVVLSRHLAQQVDQLFLHTRLLQQSRATLQARDSETAPERAWPSYGPGAVSHQLNYFKSGLGT